MVRALLPRLPLKRFFPTRLIPPLLPISRPSFLLPSSPSPLSALRTFHFLPPSPASSPPNSQSPTPTPSLSQKLKHLIKSYGWYTLGVYFILSVLDFAVAFAGINLLGAEYVASIAASVKAAVYNALHSTPPEPGLDQVDNTSVAGRIEAGNGQEGLYAMLVLAYTVHKTLFLPVRVGLTAALTPKLVGWLRAKGWAGEEGAKRAASQVRAKLKERRSRSRD
ncbi:hypothetical protein AMATHDRAFT_140917 [Amanita thiersii Skay4041]|uniref:DUF1279 domain-containing protein n=1 Tax=Amanita thiersii Skay4041 TaxID=703135 RepID=A0A2A9NPE7_9AGAR|nr:hypothetical protein AMATHDRAFT_140917 [Amanita thiersii Skay4041]